MSEPNEELNEELNEIARERILAKIKSDGGQVLDGRWIVQTIAKEIDPEMKSAYEYVVNEMLKNGKLVQGERDFAVKK